MGLQDPNNLKDYLAKNKFLADLNNEHETKSPLLKTNLASLERLVLFRFADDFTVVPKDSAWFGGYFGKQWQNLRETDLYKVSKGFHLQQWQEYENQPLVMSNPSLKNPLSLFSGCFPFINFAVRICRRHRKSLFLGFPSTRGILATLIYLIVRSFCFSA